MEKEKLKKGFTAVLYSVAIFPCAAAVVAVMKEKNTKKIRQSGECKKYAERF